MHLPPKRIVSVNVNGNRLAIIVKQIQSEYVIASFLNMICLKFKIQRNRNVFTLNWQMYQYWLIALNSRNLVHSTSSMQ